MTTEDQKIQNGLALGNETIYEFCRMESDTVDEEAALLAIMETAVTALRYRGWSQALLSEHFTIGLNIGTEMLVEEGSDLPDEPLQS